MRHAVDSLLLSYGRLALLCLQQVMSLSKSIAVRALLVVTMYHDS